eukprot:COSAG05_NODE_467_length_9529_cov_27.560976_2_plen_56_part_00
MPEETSLLEGQSKALLAGPSTAPSFFVVAKVNVSCPCIIGSSPQGCLAQNMGISV